MATAECKTRGLAASIVAALLVRFAECPGWATEKVPYEKWPCDPGHFDAEDPLCGAAGLLCGFCSLVMATRFHTVPAGSHVAPASAAVTALVDEQPGAIGGGALANSPQAIAGKQFCGASEDELWDFAA